MAKIESKTKKAMKCIVKGIEYSVQKYDGNCSSCTNCSHCSKSGLDTRLKVELVVETLKLLSSGSFSFLVMLGIILTYAHGGFPKDNLIKKNFGSNNICLFFDFEPGIFVHPPLFVVSIVFYWL